MVDNVKIIIYIKFQNILMTRRYKTLKNPKNGFSLICDPQDFFEKSGTVTFVPLWCTNFMQKIRKILRVVSEIFKDGRMDHGYGWLYRTLSGKRGVQNNKNSIYTYLTYSQTALAFISHSLKFGTEDVCMNATNLGHTFSKILLTFDFVPI